jgi:thiamine-monophosphate kinase
MVLKTDAIVGGIHFFSDDPADLVARKALRVNLSDLAAKGARPAGFLLSLAIPETVDDRWLRRFARGLGDDAKNYRCPLFGGDTDRTTGPPVIAVSTFGTVPRGTMVRRKGARVGDIVVVTGTIGDAALGLKLRQDPAAAGRWKLSDGMRRHLMSRYLLPQPRNVVAAAIRRYASAAMDISDGLAGDLTKLLRASGVSAVVEAAQVPLSTAAAKALSYEPRLIETVLTGGDDFEIMATVKPAALKRLQAMGQAVDVPITAIGRVVVGTGAKFLDLHGRTMRFKRLSFSHF